MAGFKGSPPGFYAVPKAKRCLLRFVFLNEAGEFAFYGCLWYFKKMSILFFYLFFMSLVLFSLMGADKRRAKQHAYRVPERTLFIFAAFGGCLGGVLGMLVFHHKTKHRSFRFGMPFFALLNIGTAYLILHYLIP